MEVMGRGGSEMWLLTIRVPPGPNGLFDSSCGWGGKAKQGPMKVREKWGSG